MVENNLDMSNIDNEFEIVSVELDNDSVKLIERYITLHPELGHTTVKQYLEGLLQKNMRKILEEL